MYPVIPFHPIRANDEAYSEIWRSINADEPEPWDEFVQLVEPTLCTDWYKCNMTGREWADGVPPWDECCERNLRALYALGYPAAAIVAAVDYLCGYRAEEVPVVRDLIRGVLRAMWGIWRRSIVLPRKRYHMRVVMSVLTPPPTPPLRLACALHLDAARVLQAALRARPEVADRLATVLRRAAAQAPHLLSGLAGLQRSPRRAPRIIRVTISPGSTFVVTNVLARESLAGRKHPELTWRGTTVAGSARESPGRDD